MPVGNTAFRGNCLPTGHSNSYELLQPQPPPQQRSLIVPDDSKTMKFGGWKSFCKVVFCAFGLILLLLMTTGLFLIYSSVKKPSNVLPQVRFNSNSQNSNATLTGQYKDVNTTEKQIQNIPTVQSPSQSTGLTTCRPSVLQFPTSCQDVRQRTNESGVFIIYPFHDDFNKALAVYCDQVTDGGNWMIMQRRIDNLVSFERNWAWYKRGFGDLTGNFWLGLENLYGLTKNGNYELRVEITDFNNAKTYYATYSHFSIGGQESNYTLNVTGYNGTASDQLRYHSGKPFSTFDRDNDQLRASCVGTHRGAWWHGGGSFCFSSSLNGIFQTWRPKSWTGIIWGPHHSLKKVEMKIRN